MSVLTPSLIPVFKRFTGFAKESSYGTDPLTGYRWTPAHNAKPEEVIEYQADVGLRGIGAQTFGEYQGVKRSQFSYDLDFYPIDTPGLIPLILGPDTVTGTTSPYTHTFKLASGEPASATFRDYNGIDVWAMSGARLSQMQFKLDAQKNLSASIQGQGFSPSNITLPTASFDTNPYFLGWEASVVFAGGTASNHMSMMTLTLARKLTARYGAVNSQNPTVIFVGPLQMSGSMTFEVEDDTEYDYFPNNTQPSVVITLTQPTTNFEIVFQMSKCAFTKATFSDSKDYLDLSADFTAVYNTTDSGPGLIQVLNSQSQAY